MENQNLSCKFAFVEYKVFKRTFLEKVEVRMNFRPAVSVFEHAEELTRFINKEFGLPPGKFDVPSEAATIAVDESKGNIHLEMGNGKAAAVISKGFYKSFEYSLQPRLNRLQRFIEEVEGVSQVDELILTKHNRWQFNCENPVEEITNVLQVVFKTDYAKLLFPTERPGENLATFTIAHEDTSNIDGVGELHSEMSIKVSKTDKKLVLRLDLEGKAQNVRVENADMTAHYLNQAIFKKFTEAVSEDVLNLMDKED